MIRIILILGVTLFGCTSSSQNQMDVGSSNMQETDSDSHNVAADMDTIAPVENDAGMAGMDGDMSGMGGSGGVAGSDTDGSMSDIDSDTSGLGGSGGVTDSELGEHDGGMPDSTGMGGDDNHADAGNQSGQDAGDGMVSLCDGVEDGTALTEGGFGQCEYTDDCAETGQKSRIAMVCENGRPIEAVITAICTRDTDGRILDEGTFGECMYDDQCTEQGIKQRTETLCSDGMSVARVVTSSEGCLQVTGIGCDPIECTSHDQCADDELCLCPGYWYDQDADFSCDDFTIAPRVCLPCSGHVGSVCVFEDLPERGRTVNNLCDVGNWPPFLYSGACPPECDPSAGVSTCPNAWDFCNADGRCEPRDPP